jgi:hypothetical protein
VHRKRIIVRQPSVKHLLIHTAPHLRIGFRPALHIPPARRQQRLISHSFYIKKNTSRLMASNARPGSESGTPPPPAARTLGRAQCTNATWRGVGERARLRSARPAPPHNTGGWKSQKHPPSTGAPIPTAYYYYCTCHIPCTGARTQLQEKTGGVGAFFFHL